MQFKNLCKEHKNLFNLPKFLKSLHKYFWIFHKNIIIGAYYKDQNATSSCRKRRWPNCSKICLKTWYIHFRSNKGDSQILKLKLKVSKKIYSHSESVSWAKILFIMKTVRGTLFSHSPFLFFILICLSYEMNDNDNKEENEKV